MAKKAGKKKASVDPVRPEAPHQLSYGVELRMLQIEMVKLQKHLIATGAKVLLLFEGRDGAGKDGTIKRLTEHLSPRETRVVALGKPTERERSGWYFQRYVPHLPTASEFVCFNRSWYNRAGVERVMGFCTEAEVDEFFDTVPYFEQMLVRSGIVFFKYFLDVDRNEQRKRLKARQDDPLKQWKLSPIDKAAISRWDEYSKARNEMFARTHSPIAPWTIVQADEKRPARLSVMRDVLTRIEYEGKDGEKVLPNPEMVFPYHDSYLRNGMIAA